ARKDWGQAAAHLRTAVAAGERRVAEVDDPLLAATGRGGRVERLYSFLAVTLAADGKPAEAFQAAERAKAGALTATLKRGGVSVRKGMTPAERAEDDRLRATLARAAHL